MAPMLDLYSTKGHGKQIAFLNGNANSQNRRSKNERFAHQLYGGFNKLLPKLSQGNRMHIYFDCEYYYKRSKISHHKKSASVLYNAKS